MQFLDIQHAVKQLLLKAPSAIPKERVESLLETNDAGEPEVALEGLCSNLDDFDCLISHLTREEIKKLGVMMNLEKDYWERLKVE